MEEATPEAEEKPRRRRSKSRKNKHRRRERQATEEGKAEASSSDEAATPRPASRSSHVINGHGNETARSHSSRQDAELDSHYDATRNGIESRVQSVHSYLEKIQENGDATFTDECRRVFREEIRHLRKETEDFRKYCLQQIDGYKSNVERQRQALQSSSAEQTEGGAEAERKTQETTEGAAKEPEKDGAVERQLSVISEDMEYFQRKQKLLDKETELLQKEEDLSKKQQSLAEYEKEIEEVEAMLNQRQAICERRQRALTALDEELHTLRSELESAKESFNESDAEAVEDRSEKAQRNWDLVRRNLLDRQSMLECTVQRYRQELASASSTIAGKDILISKQQTQIGQLEEDMAAKDKRIKQLETKVTLALAEVKFRSDDSSPSGMSHAPNSSQRRHSLYTPPSSHLQNGGSKGGDMQHGSSRLVRHRSQRERSASTNTRPRSAREEDDGSSACAVM